MNPVKRRRKKTKYPSTLARSQEKIKCFLENKSSGKPDLASPEDKGITVVPCKQDSVNSLRVKELENTSLACSSSSGELMSSENPTSDPTSDADLLNEQEILREYLDTVNLDSDDDMCSVSVCGSCKRQPKKWRGP